MQSQLQQLRAPEDRVWEVYSNWFRQAKPFVGHSRELLKDDADFVTLAASGQHDVITRFVVYLIGLINVVRHDCTTGDRTATDQATVEKGFSESQECSYILPGERCSEGHHLIEYYRCDTVPRGRHRRSILRPKQFATLCIDSDFNSTVCCCHISIHQRSSCGDVRCYSSLRRSSRCFCSGKLEYQWQSELKEELYISARWLYSDGGD